MATDRPRFTVSVTDEQFEKINEYKDIHGLSTRSKAVEALIKLGMQALDGKPIVCEIPVDNRETELLEKFNALNNEGKERLLETADDMVKSGKYIKSNHTRVPKAG